MVQFSDDEYYELLFQNTSDLIYELDQHGRYLRVNKAVEEQTGYSFQELKELTCWDLVPLEYRNQIQGHYKSILRKQTSSYYLEFPILTKQNTELWMSQSVHFRYDDSTAYRAYAIAKNITQAKKREILKDQYIDGLRLLNNIQTNVDLSIKGRLKNALQACTNFLDLELGIISTINGDEYLIDYYHSKDPDLKLARELHTKGTYCDITMKVGSMVVIDEMSTSEYRNHPCYDNFNLEVYVGEAYYIHDQVAGTVNFSSSKKRKSDFTQYEMEFVSLLTKWVGVTLERLAVMQELAKSNNQLQVINAEKDKLIAIVGHDLRNPLSALKNLSELISESGHEMDKDDIIEMSTTMNTAAMRGLNLIEEIIDWGMVTTSASKIEKVDILSLVKKITEVFQLNIEKKKIHVEILIDEEYQFVNSSKFVLELLIRNFISNAIKFTDVHGQITIEAVNLENSYQITVKDTGTGMTEETANQLLQMDSRISMKGTDQEEGTGLGLKLCMDALNKIGGNLKIESKLNEGSSFIVTIPAD
ncbi:MAG: PAS domain-containing sensor histidine kinase [bacterium]|nr:PAS domain-containing sensor histidine kinase [bacterium]